MKKKRFFDDFQKFQNASTEIAVTFPKLKISHQNLSQIGNMLENNPQFLFRREQESFHSSREQRIFWGPETAFQNSKNADIFFN
jgi:hypothetical protein